MSRDLKNSPFFSSGLHTQHVDKDRCLKKCLWKYQCQRYISILVWWMWQKCIYHILSPILFNPFLILFQQRRVCSQFFNLGKLDTIANTNIRSLYVNVHPSFNCCYVTNGHGMTWNGMMHYVVQVCGVRINRRLHVTTKCMTESSKTQRNDRTAVTAHAMIWHHTLWLNSIQNDITACLISSPFHLVSEVYASLLSSTEAQFRPIYHAITQRFPSASRINILTSRKNIWGLFSKYQR